MTRREWLESIKEGQRVRVCFFWDTPKYAVVTSVTQYVIMARIEDHRKRYPYSKDKGGFYCAPGILSSYLAPATREESTAVRWTKTEQIFYNTRYLGDLMYTDQEADILIAALKNTGKWHRPPKGDFPS